MVHRTAIKACGKARLGIYRPKPSGVGSERHLHCSVLMVGHMLRAGGRKMIEDEAKELEGATVEASRGAGGAVVARYAFRLLNCIDAASMGTLVTTMPTSDAILLLTEVRATDILYNI